MRGIETRAQLQPNGRRVCREILDRHARRPVSLDPPYRGGRYPQRPGDVRLPQAGGQPSLAKVEAVLGDQASSGEPRLVDASETICHAPIICDAALPRPYPSRISIRGHSVTTTG